MAEWRDINLLLDDVFRFAKENPRHQFLWNDRIGFGFGILAFIDDPLDEQVQEWTIPIGAARATMLNRTRGVLLSSIDVLARAMETGEGKRRLLEALVVQARKPDPPNLAPVHRRSRWEIIGQDDED